jgi:hypothetical protein
MCTARRHDCVIAESLPTQFLHSDVEVDCPACQYPIWITWAEIVVQAVVRCPCCRIGLRAWRYALTGR